MPSALEILFAFLYEGSTIVFFDGGHAQTTQGGSFFRGGGGALFHTFTYKNSRNWKNINGELIDAYQDTQLVPHTQQAVEDASRHCEGTLIFFKMYFFSDFDSYSQELLNTHSENIDTLDISLWFLMQLIVSTPHFPSFKGAPASKVFCSLFDPK